MDTKIVIGCNYHIKSQKDKSMRFVLIEVNGGFARLATRTTMSVFWVEVGDLVFINTDVNKEKANRISKTRSISLSSIESEIDINAYQYLKVSKNGEYFILQDKSEFKDLVFVRDFISYSDAYLWITGERIDFSDPSEKHKITKMWKREGAFDFKEWKKNYWAYRNASLGNNKNIFV